MQGQLFSQDFLQHGIRETAPYVALDEAAFEAFERRLANIFGALKAAATLNEAQTEQLPIERFLLELGWREAAIGRSRALDDVLALLRSLPTPAPAHSPSSAH